MSHGIMSITFACDRCTVAPLLEGVGTEGTCTDPIESDLETWRRPLEFSRLAARRSIAVGVC